MRIIKPSKLLLLSTVIIVSFSSLKSQAVYNDSSITEKHDDFSEHLINGPVYYQSNPFSKGSPFLYENFLPANIYTCNRDFESIQINFDILDQKLVILLIGKNKTKTPLDINPILIDSINVKGYTFVANNGTYVNVASPFFVEMKNSLATVILTYHKDFIKSYSQENPYGFISDIKNRTYLLNTDNSASDIRSFKFLRDLYPKKWKLIKKYIRKRGLIFRNMSLKQMDDLLVYCDSI